MRKPGSSATAAATLRHARAASAASCALIGLHGGANLLGFEIADGAAEPFTSKLLLPPGPLRPWALFTSVGGGGAPGASLSLLGYSGDGGPGLNLPLPAQRQSQREASARSLYSVFGYLDMCGGRTGWGGARCV